MSKKLSITRDPAINPVKSNKSGDVKVISNKSGNVQVLHMQYFKAYVKF